MWKICPTCGKKFRVPPSQSFRKYCSRSCQVEDERWREHISKAKKSKKSLEKTCPVCGKIFKVSPSLKRRRYCSRDCWVKDDEWRRHISEGRKGQKVLTPEQYRELANARTKYHWTYEELYRLYWIEGKTEAEMTKELGAGAGTIHRYLVKLGIPRRHKLVAAQRKPNAPERFLINFLEANELPFKYTGSGELIVGGRVPDFVHTKDKKVIELFGIYWHSPLLNPKMDPKRTYQGLKKHYRKYGYQCLIIWESELNDRERLLKKITRFLKK